MLLFSRLRLRPIPRFTTTLRLPTKTMSSTNFSSTSFSSSSSTPSPKDQSTPSSQNTLPAPGESSTTTLDVSGDGTTVKLDHLGPLVVNVDGTMSRIGNWAEMAEIEKQNAARIIGRRNKQRLEVLRKEKEGE